MIDKLEMFIALANERHFGRAAEAMGVTQPSLSGAIKQLEDQLGVQLVFRGSRFQGLTPEGARVLTWALKIVADTRTMRDEMRTLRRGVSGNLRIGVIPTALPVISELTSPFLEQNPNVALTILSCTSAEILDGIERLELEAGVTYLDNEPLGRVVQVPLYRETYVLLMGREHALAGRTSVRWEEAATERLCLLTGDMQNRRIINQHLAEAGAHVHATVESNSTIALISHVASGGWVSIMPRAVAAMFRGGGLVSVPMIEPDARHMVGLIAGFRDTHTPVLAALLETGRKIARV